MLIWSWFGRIRTLLSTPILSPFLLGRQLFRWFFRRSYPDARSVANWCWFGLGSAESGLLFLLRPFVPFFWDDNYLGDSFDDHICMQKASSMLVWSWLNLYSKSSFRSWTLSLCIVYLLHYDAIAWDSFQFYYHLSSHMTLSTLLLCDTFGHDPKTWLKPLPCVSFMRESSHNAIESGIVLNSCTVR